ncbi:MAG TPA: hypothetical protein VMU50_09870 [Polyangia bacterium]|jgi:hypothetical protein|nr:hypothetical protein [Polyangia bacterium]
MARRSANAKRRRPEDVAVVFGRTDDQQGLHILRRRAEGQPVEMGTLRPLREGKPIDGEVISLRPRRDYPFVCDVKVELPDPSGDHRSTSDGPAQVASDGYRRGWEAIWGRPTSAAKAN